jgi:hypothetical protein
MLRHMKLASTPVHPSLWSARRQCAEHKSTTEILHGQITFYRMPMNGHMDITYEPEVHKIIQPTGVYSGISVYYLCIQYGYRSSFSECNVARLLGSHLVYLLLPRSTLWVRLYFQLHNTPQCRAFLLEVA